MLANWKTTGLGILVALCTGTSYLAVLPDTWSSSLMLFCGVCTAFGLIAAKDSNVTNAANPVESKTVS